MRFGNDAIRLSTLGQAFLLRTYNGLPGSSLVRDNVSASSGIYVMTTTKTYDPLKRPLLVRNFIPSLLRRPP